MYGKKTTTKNTLEYRIEKINTLIKRCYFKVKNGNQTQQLYDEITHLQNLKSKYQKQLKQRVSTLDIFNKYFE
jgi:hypothetical protein